MKPPTIYAEWIPVLEKFGRGEQDGDVVAALQAGRLPLFQEVLERFTVRLKDAMDKRYARLVKQFQEQGGVQNPDQVESGLKHLQQGLDFLKQAVTLPALPENMRREFPGEIQRGADRLQQSLEKSALQDPTGQLRHLLQLYPVNRLEANHEQ